jgi:hypothetical protein
MYEFPSSLLVANPINRYPINSPMLNGLTKDPDGGITLYIQKASPGPTKRPAGCPHRKARSDCSCGCTGPKTKR